MRSRIIGRDNEIARLERYVSSGRSEFVAIYGRRRVGKTFLVKELFDGSFAFRTTGVEGASMAEQLQNFSMSLQNFTPVDTVARNWPEAFGQLKRYLERLPAGNKILFIDELPWFDTIGSNFLRELEHFWNDWASYRDDVKLIACGSATTWMLSNLINSRGGLHNRVTHEIALAPFSLFEVEQYFKSRGFDYARSELLECYMAVGGVAYYLSLFEPGLSVAQNIDRLCFRRGGELTHEFERLYQSLFKKADVYIDIVTQLAKKGKGMTRLELLGATQTVNNGNFTKKLDELEMCDFIRSYQPFGKVKKEVMFQLVDPFTLLYFRFMRDHGSFLNGYWLKMQGTAAYRSWCGYAFEIVCLNHVEQIVTALGIDGMINTVCSWSYAPRKNQSADAAGQHGAQIDLLIDRMDNTVNVCEIKYSLTPYVIDKDCFDGMMRRIETFKAVTKTSKSTVPVFITSAGLAANAYARRLPRNVTGDDLFVAQRGS